MKRTAIFSSILILVVVLHAGFLAPRTLGQSVNIDYGGGSGTPTAIYAGAGMPGVWNGLTGAHGVAESLVGLDGTAVPATVTLLDGAGGALHSVNDPGTTGGDEYLLDDYVLAGTDVVGTVRFEGLENGTYLVVTYAWTPGDPQVQTAVWPDCDTTGDLILIGGSWPGRLGQGVTHWLHTTNVTDGNLSICTAGGLFWEGALNGIQLVATDCDNGEPEMCLLPPDVGPCDGVCPRFFYNPCAGTCEPFGFGCCDGNANNFMTLEECEAACTRSEEVCSLPPVVGDCTGAFPRYFHDVCTGQCLPFTYGGCGGNANNFLTPEVCEDVCSPAGDVCALPADAGPCLGVCPRFFHNVCTGQCESFSYGCCQGNANNFLTLEECEGTCPPVTDPCGLPAVVGPCEAYMPKFYFNAVTGQCESFIYGGCEGNANNFLTLEECQVTCPVHTGGTIPAVSEWGLIVMALLVLATGTLVCMRRRPA